MSWRRIGESALQVDNSTMSYFHLAPYVFLSCSRKHFLFNRSLKPEGLTQLCSVKDICPSPFTFLSCTHSLHLCGVMPTAWLLGYLNRQERVHAGRAGTGVKSSLLVLMQRYLFDWSSSGNNGSPIPEQNVLSVAF